MKDRVAFCICTKNRKSKLKKNLHSITRLKDFKKYDIEIILVSNDRSNYDQIIRQYKRNFKIK